ncbi:hypothetical protein PRK78_006629 [Emydomyces testavorans]|uniref:Uncharacterized protein n=1 Tax=Emydomyces testavorans TaxID=2070801 RepID=A0AAF0INS5_9EURO|nr:hypothetical protein PRK78_006629 [Emydomyces testavorans]
MEHYPTPRLPPARETPGVVHRGVSEADHLAATPSSRSLPFEILYIVACEADPQRAGVSNHKPDFRVIDHEPSIGDQICGLLFFNNDRSTHTMHSDTDTGQIVFENQEIDVSIELNSASKPRTLRAHSVARAFKPQIRHTKTPTSKATKSHHTQPDFSAQTQIPPSSNNLDSTSPLHLRGGCFSVFKKNKRLEDDEVVPAVIWWLAGGRLDGARPTGKRLREWKQASRGNWDEGRQRGFFQECVFVLSRGKRGRDQRGKHWADPPAGDPPTDGGGSSVLTM